MGNLKLKLQLAVVAMSVMFVACLLISFRVVLVDLRKAPNSNYKEKRNHQLRHHGKNGVNTWMNSFQKSLLDFQEASSSQHAEIKAERNTTFIRYSQRNQKDPETEKLLDEKQNQHQQQKESDTMQHLWRGYRQVRPEDATNDPPKSVKIGYRPGARRKRYKKILYFLHIHKSAGSTFCRQAYLNRISANYNNNCNVQADQRCCGKEDTVAAQREYARTTPYDLVAVEQEMLDSMVPEVYDYIVTLRMSQRRYYSHWNHLFTTAESLKERDLAYLRKQLERGDANATNTTVRVSPEHIEAAWRDFSIGNHRPDSLRAAAEDPVHWNLTIRDDNGTVHPVGNFTKWYMGQPDNYNVRMICGVKCSRVKKYQLTSQLFAYTLRRLAQFQHVLFVEDLDASFERFAEAYGWQYNPGAASSGHLHSGRRMNATELTTRLKEDVRWDPYMSVLDDALYEFARRKYDHAPYDELWNMTSFANQAMVEDYYRLGPSRGCTNECCGVCSKW